MKRLVIATIMLTLAFVTKAQYRWAFIAGPTFGKVNRVVDDDKGSSGWNTGFRAGMTVDIALGKQLSFQPSFDYLRKGGEETSSVGNPPNKTYIRLNYLELPLNFIYYFPGKNGHLIAGIGPCLAFGLAGKEFINSNGTVMTEIINWGNYPDELRHLEFSGTMLLGYEWKMGLVVTLHYNVGFNNLTQDTENKWKNEYFGITLGYFLLGRND